MRIKYIMFDDIFPVIFPEGFNHDNVRASYIHRGAEPTSAGFVTIKADGTSPDPGVISPYSKLVVKCHGESTSLKLKSKPKLDSEIIERFLNGE